MTYSWSRKRQFMNLKEFAEIWINDTNKFKVLCVCLLIILVINQINFYNDLKEYKNQWDYYQCFTRGYIAVMNYTEFKNKTSFKYNQSFINTSFNLSDNNTIK